MPPHFYGSDSEQTNKTSYSQGKLLQSEPTQTVKDLHTKSLQHVKWRTPKEKADKK